MSRRQFAKTVLTPVARPTSPVLSCPRAAYAANPAHALASFESRDQQVASPGPRSNPINVSLRVTP
ncbi:hypothetical protein [Acrocarpospora sp. B8E8]|uniref:hypothetical protein n=1 Tax=Acrocarpospora sp. B8E8 TaxID=3153572 RepID=UPI00325FB057